MAKRSILVTCLLYALMLALSYAFLYGCGSHEKNEESGFEEGGAKQVVATRIESGQLKREDVFPAELLAYQDVAIYPKVPGFIKWIGVDRGSVVEKNQLMVVLEAPELVAQKNAADSKAAAARAELAESESRLKTSESRKTEVDAKLDSDSSTNDRIQAAAKVPGVVSENEAVVSAKLVEADRAAVAAQAHNVLAMQNEVHALKEKVAAAEKEADSYRDIAQYLEVRSPFYGYVTERDLHTGSFVGPLGKGAYPPIVRLQELSLLRLVAPVPEVDAGGVELGQSVGFTVSTYPGETFFGTVARIGNSLDQKTRTMPVELNVPNQKWRLKPGMFAEVHWPTRRKHETLFVPVSAVATTTYKPFLCVLDGGVVKYVQVKRGLNMDDKVEVFGDLKAGQLVALDGTDELREGTRVIPQIASESDINAQQHRERGMSE
jgi:membrane fusion protein, multidrug efflux system